MKKLIIPLIIVFVLAFGIGGYFLLQKSKPAKTPTTKRPSKAQTSKQKLKFDFPGATSDPFDDPRGPFYHQIFKASSNDGLSFAKEEEIVFDKASVPDIIRLPNGHLIIYAVDGASRSKSGIMVAISDNQGKTWQKGSLQLNNPENFGGADPEAVVLEDGKVRLYYVVFPKIEGPPGQSPQGETPPGLGAPIDPKSGAPRPEPVAPSHSLAEPAEALAKAGKNKIFSAISTDGVYFQEEEGVRFEYPQITDPDVVKIGDKWFMYLSQGPRLIAASSLDGFNFKLERTIREQGSVSNTVPIGNNLWRQFFCDRGIKSAVSSDGLTWQEDSGFRLQAEPNQIMCDPAPVQIDSGWLLFYKVGPGLNP